MKDNLQQISTQINDKSEKNNFSTKPNVIAVTKYVTIERAKEAYEAGIRHFGENRLEGFFQKKEALPSDAVIDPRMAASNTYAVIPTILLIIPTIIICQDN